MQVDKIVLRFSDDPQRQKKGIRDPPQTKSEAIRAVGLPASSVVRIILGNDVLASSSLLQAEYYNIFLP